MFSHKKILVPFDFSDVSRAALSLALQQAHSYDGEVHVLFADPKLDKDLKKRLVTAPNDTVIEDSIAQNEQAIFQAAELEYQRAVEAGHPLKPCKVIPHLTGGSYYDTCMNFVQELGIDAIIVGTHGRVGFIEALRGTETEAMVKDAPCSVFVVKPQGFPYLTD